jgi:hypothetical protein
MTYLTGLKNADAAMARIHDLLGSKWNLRHHVRQALRESQESPFTGQYLHMEFDGDPLWGTRISVRARTAALFLVFAYQEHADELIFKHCENEAALRIGTKTIELVAPPAALMGDMLRDLIKLAGTGQEPGRIPFPAGAQDVPLSVSFVTANKLPEIRIHGFSGET